MNSHKAKVLYKTLSTPTSKSATVPLVIYLSDWLLRIPSDVFIESCSL